MTATRNKKEEMIVAEDAATWLVEHLEGDESLAGTESYRVLSRTKMIQPSAASELKDQFGEGACILAPDLQMICSPRPTGTQTSNFIFIPLFFFVEYTEQSDLKDKANQFIMSRSFDSDSDIAVKARSEKTREQAYENEAGLKFTKKFVEHLCFVGAVYGPDGHPCQNHPLCVSFEKGEFQKGQQFISAIKMRKIGGKTAPLWAQKWVMTPALRKRGGHEWWGLDFANPVLEDGIYIKSEEGIVYKQLHLDIKADHVEKRLRVDRSDDDGVDTSAEARAAAAGIEVD